MYLYLSSSTGVSSSSSDVSLVGDVSLVADVSWLDELASLLPCSDVSLSLPPGVDSAGSALDILQEITCPRPVCAFSNVRIAGCCDILGVRKFRKCCTLGRG